jgi:hypothetical protein
MKEAVYLNAKALVAIDASISISNARQSRWHSASLKYFEKLMS